MEVKHRPVATETTARIKSSCCTMFRRGKEPGRQRISWIKVGILNEVRLQVVVESRRNERTVCGKSFTFKSSFLVVIDLGSQIQSIDSFNRSFVQAISRKVHYYSEALPTQHRYCVGVSCRSATGNCQ